MTVLLRKSYGG